MSEYVLHIINYKEKPYVAGPEIAHILFGQDILRTRVSSVFPPSIHSATDAMFVDKRVVSRTCSYKIVVFSYAQRKYNQEKLSFLKNKYQDCLKNSKSETPA